MIFINPDRILKSLPRGWKTKINKLNKELLNKSPNDRAAYIKAKRYDTWADKKLLTSLRAIAGNKCWYSEVILTGSDPNIDHFRPKNRVTEIDNNSFVETGQESPGYWWLAFEPQNFRLACMHANQRRVDNETDGGKWDYFPIEGPRAAELTKLSAIREEVLPFDPCSASDVAKIWFSPDGTPALRKTKPTAHDKLRLKVTVWLYHLDKVETAKERAAAMEDIKLELTNANAFYNLWKNPHNKLDPDHKFIFDAMLAKINAKIADDAEFSGAKRTVVQAARSEYKWMEEFMPQY